MKLNFSNNDRLFNLNNNDNDITTKEYLFGDIYGNCLKIKTSSNNNISSIELDSINEIIERRFNKDKNKSKRRTLINKYYSDYVYDYIKEFKTYLDDNSIVINIYDDDEITDIYIDNDNKTIIGYKNQEIGYIKQYLTREEKKELEKRLKKNGTIFNRQVPDNRFNIIEQIEKDNNVYIIQSTDFGSKAWGYASKDSDDDFRFIYVKKLQDYFSFDDSKTTIEYPLEDGNDILGYEIGKFIKLISSQSPMAYEIINTPYKDLDSDEFELLREFSNKYFQPEKIIKAYENILKNNIEKLRTEDRKSLKLYLYILRMFGIINYIRKTKEFPVCTIQNIFSIEENSMFKDEIVRIINLKIKGEKNINVTDELINNLLLLLERVKKDNKDDDVNINLEELKNEAKQLYYQFILYSKEREDLEEIIRDSDTSLKNM